MRTIKFRIWDRLLKGWTRCNFWRIDYNIDSLNDIFTANRYVFQQSTGWLDSSFNEIYEGDIVSFSVPGHAHGPEKEFYENMAVRFDEEFGGWEFVSGRGMGEYALSVFGDCIDIESFTITGNIFETK